MAGVDAVSDGPFPRHSIALTVSVVGSPSRTRMRPARVERCAWDATAETMGDDRADTVSRWDIVKVGISSALERPSTADTLTADPDPRRAMATRAPEARNTNGLDASHAAR